MTGINCLELVRLVKRTAVVLSSELAYLTSKVNVVLHSDILIFD